MGVGMSNIIKYYFVQLYSLHIHERTWTGMYKMGIMNYVKCDWTKVYHTRALLGPPGGNPLNCACMHQHACGLLTTLAADCVT